MNCNQPIAIAIDRRLHLDDMLAVSTEQRRRHRRGYDRGDIDSADGAEWRIGSQLGCCRRLVLFRHRFPPASI